MKGAASKFKKAFSRILESSRASRCRVPTPTPMSAAISFHRMSMTSKGRRSFDGQSDN
jgi:hypothetical protein